MLGVNIKRALVAVALLSATVTAQAGYNDPIVFGQDGNVSLTVGDHVGLFDHILELNNTIGPVGPGPVGGNPLLVPLSSSGSGNVLGFATASTGDIFQLGSFASGHELAFRLSNIYPADTLYSQIFSGSSSNFNPSNFSGGDIYTYVAYGGPNQINVTFEDLFSWDASNPPAVSDFLANADVSFTLTLNPVPEPESYAMLLAGLGMLGFMARRRKQKAA